MESEFYKCVHKKLQLDPILCQFPVYTLFFLIFTLILWPPIYIEVSQVASSLQIFSKILYIFLISPIPATYLTFFW
jgi:hypothetical protein